MAKQLTPRQGYKKVLNNSLRERGITQAMLRAAIEKRVAATTAVSRRAEKLKALMAEFRSKEVSLKSLRFALAAVQ
jgi:hypothetical protein